MSVGRNDKDITDHIKDLQAAVQQVQKRTMSYDWIALTNFASGVVAYTTQYGGTNGLPRAKKFKNGLVLLDGVLGFTAAKAASATLLTLPSGILPGFQQTQPVGVAGTSGTGTTGVSRLVVLASGVCADNLTGYGGTSASFLYLSGYTYFAEK